MAGVVLVAVFSNSASCHTHQKTVDNSTGSGSALWESLPPELGHIHRGGSCSEKSTLPGYLVGGGTHCSSSPFPSLHLSSCIYLFSPSPTLYICLTYYFCTKSLILNLLSLPFFFPSPPSLPLSLLPFTLPFNTLPSLYPSPSFLPLSLPSLPSLTGSLLQCGHILSI